MHPAEVSQGPQADFASRRTRALIARLPEYKIKMMKEHLLSLPILQSVSLSSCSCNSRYR